MSKKSKPELTKKLKSRYKEILEGWDGKNYRWTIWDGEYWCWAAFRFAKQWHGRNIDLARLANIVLRSEDAECCYRYAREIPDAPIRKFQRQVIRYGTSELMRRFSREIPGADCAHLEGMACIADIMQS